MLFGTTSEFLRVFSLKSIQELPPIESFQPTQDTISDAFEKISSKIEENTLQVDKNVLSD